MALQRPPLVAPSAALSGAGVRGSSPEVNKQIWDREAVVNVRMLPKRRVLEFADAPKNSVPDRVMASRAVVGGRGRPHGLL